MLKRRAFLLGGAAMLPGTAQAFFTPFSTSGLVGGATVTAIPTIAAISPNSWTLAGGTSASITGTNFTGATAVTIGGQAATNINVVSPTQITCVVPPSATAGAKSVIVTTPTGQNAINTLFTYGTYTSTLPAISTLPQLTSLPDPFLLNNGARCVTKADWVIRRVELIEQVKYYIYGHIPGPVPVNVVSTSADQVQTGGTMRLRSVVLSFACPNGALKPVTVKLWMPVVKGTPFPNGVSGSGPWPTLIGADHSFSPLDQTPTATQNESIGLPALNALVSRGYIIAEIGRDDFVLDWADDGLDATYQSGAYTKFPFDRAGNAVAGFDWGTIAGWAWGEMRVMDYLMTLGSPGPNLVDTSKIGLTGHSRSSNTAELAAALDTRFALVVCNQNALSLFRNAGLDTWTHYAPAESGWFSPKYFTTIGGGTVQCQGAFDVNGNPFACDGNTARIPFDTHALAGLVAPRLYLNLMSLVDPLREPREAAQRYFAAREIWIANGADPDNYRLWETNDPAQPTNNFGHSFNANMWNAALDFADNRWYGKALPPDVPPPIIPSYQWTISSLSPVFGGLPKAYNWSTPILT